MAKSPLPLLGRDSLHKPGATIHLDGNIMEINVSFEKGHRLVMLLVNRGQKETPVNKQVELLSKSSYMISRDSRRNQRG